MSTDKPTLTVEQVIAIQERNKSGRYPFIKTVDALCTTVRHLLEENRQLRASWEVSEQRSTERLNLAFQDKFALQTEVSRLTRERNEALDQCTELHRQIAELK